MKSVTQASKELGCTRSWVWFLIQTKRLTAEKVGNTYIIDDKELNKFIKERGRR